MKGKEKKSNIKLFIIGAIVFLIFIFPLYWMIVTALKTQVEIFKVPTPLWPKDLTFEAFADQFSASSDTLRGFKNSLIIAVGSTAIATILAIPAAYGLARFRFKLRKAFILFFLITQMLPSTLILTSLYIMFSNMGLLNSYAAPILACLLYQLDDSHLGSVAASGTYLDDPCVAAVAVSILRCNFVNELL